MNDGRFQLYQQPFPPGEYAFVQLAFVVGDVLHAAQEWTSAHGVGPFFVLPDAGPRTLRHRDNETLLETRIAVSQAGPVQIELIEERSDTPSVYRDVLGARGAGAHHMATMVHDYERALQHYRSVGYEIAAEQHVAGLGRVAFVDTSRRLGLMTELIEWSDRFLAALSGTAKACSGWDGSDPVRLMRADGGYDTPERPPPTGRNQHDGRR